MLTTLNGIFAKPKPYRINFIEENKRKIKEIDMVNQSNRSRLDVTKSKNSQIEIRRNISSATGLKENRHLSSSKCKLTANGSMVVFMQEKKDKGSISNVSLSTKRKSSHKVLTTKNQSCQTIDPRKCDQLFHDGIIKYPSSKIMQELDEIEKQKANRLDVHVKKEFFKRNRVKQKIPKKINFVKVSGKVSEKGDQGENENCSDVEDDEEGGGGGKQGEDEEEEDDDDDDDDDEEEEDKEEEVKEQKHIKSSEPKIISGISTKVNGNQPPPLIMCAAEIIRKTTENINTHKKDVHFNHVPNNKGDSKAVKKSQKISRNDEILNTILDHNCPPGHIPLPDVERKKTLHMLRVSHAELVREMNLLPVRTDTLRVRQKKMQLEAQLNKIEEGIKVFNKSKVYVKIEE